jgi:basic membrane protein A
MRSVAALTLISLALAAAPACRRARYVEDDRSKVHVGIVFDIGGKDDRSFNAAAWRGVKCAETGTLPDGETSCGKPALGIVLRDVEPGTPNAIEPAMRAFAERGYDLVIGVGFLMAEAIGTVSGQFPNIHFAIIDGAGTDSKGNDLKHANVQSLFFKEQDAGAMVGVIAGWLEKNGKAKKNKHVVSAVGGISIPPVNHYIAGYKWAAKMEDPTIKVLVGYSNNFTDPAKCKGVAQSQLNQNSDVVFQVAGGCGLGALQAAGQGGVYSVGVDADQKDADPSVIASALKKVDVATYTAIKNVVNGQFTGGALTFSIANEGAGYAIDNFQVPAELQTELDKVLGQIKSGALVPPADIPA